MLRLFQIALIGLILTLAPLTAALATVTPP
jgi:hypothetical protein